MILAEVTIVCMQTDTNLFHVFLRRPTRPILPPEKEWSLLPKVHNLAHFGALSTLLYYKFHFGVHIHFGLHRTKIEKLSVNPPTLELELKYEFDELHQRSSTAVK